MKKLKHYVWYCSEIDGLAVESMELVRLHVDIHGTFHVRSLSAGANIVYTFEFYLIGEL